MSFKKREKERNKPELKPINFKNGKKTTSKIYFNNFLTQMKKCIGTCFFGIYVGNTV